MHVQHRPAAAGTGRLPAAAEVDRMLAVAALGDEPRHVPGGQCQGGGVAARMLGQGGAGGHGGAQQQRHQQQHQPRILHRCLAAVGHGQTLRRHPCRAGVGRSRRCGDIGAGQA
jgi:hypothetical protein